ncbi:MAG: TonB-dependent receptor [Rhodothermaceae bacterium]|nr:MAG: TonB-dependent receptor [Rhodothermaceae bacterium]
MRKRHLWMLGWACERIGGRGRGHVERLMSRSLPFSFALLVAVLVAVPGVLAQGGMIRGTVRDAETGHPLPLVNVTLEREAVVVAGGATDEAGRYHITGVPPGAYTLFARFIGYRTAEAGVVVGPEPVEVNLRLQPAVLEMAALEVAASPFQEKEDVNVSLTRIRPQEVRQVAGAGEDVLLALQTLPGVVAASDFSNQLIVRGGTPDQNLILLDGIEVFSPYQLNGVGSLLNPFLIRQVDLYAGAFPVNYGDRLSSVLAVQTRDGTTDRWLGGQIGTNLTTATLVLEGKTGFWGGSWLVSGRRTYFDTFANTFARRVGVFNDIAFPDFADVQGKLSFRPARDHYVRLTGFHSRDKLDIVAETDPFGVQAGAEGSLFDNQNTAFNTGFGTSWAYVPDAGTQVRLYGNWYRNRGRSGLGGNVLPHDGGFPASQVSFTGPPPALFGGVSDTVRFRFDQAYRFRKVSFGGEARFRSGRHDVEFGGEVNLLENRVDLGLDLNTFGAFVFDTFRATNRLVGALVDSLEAARRFRRYAIYLQDKIATPDGEAFIQPSLRYDHYTLSGRGYLSPRISLSIALDEGTTVRVAGGRYVQSPGFEKLLDPDNLFSLARFTRLDSLAAEEALHLGVSLNRRYGERWNVRLEAYWKQFDRLVVQASRPVTRATAEFLPVGGTDRVVGQLDPSAYRIRTETVFELTTEPVSGGAGRAYGVELLIEHRRLRPGDAWSGWLSYAFARAERARSAGEGGPVPFDYDRRHAVNLVVDRHFGRHVHVALTWRFGTGFPYTPARGVEPLVAVVDDPVNEERRGVVLTDPATGYVRLVPRYGNAENVNSARLPAYHRLDVRFTFVLPWRRGVFEFYLDLINVYNRRNVLAYRYFIDVIEPPGGLPGALTPPPKPVLFREPVYMFPFIPSFGFNVSF